MKKIGQLFFVVAIFNCRTVDEYDIPKEDSKFVVNSMFNTDSLISLYLYGSEFILESEEYESIKDAEVIISDEDRSLVEKLKYVETTNDVDQYGRFQGRYISDFYPEAGRRYNIKVTHPDYPTAFSSDSIPSQPIHIENISTREWVDHKLYAETSFTIQDLEGEDFYEFKVLVYESKYEKDSLIYSINSYEYLSTEDPIFKEDYQEGHSLIISDILFNNNKHLFNIRYQALASECYTDVCIYRKYYLIVRRVSYSYYTFKETSILQWSLRDDPLSESVNVYNNIENGYGIFGGFKNYNYRLEVPNNNLSQN